MFDGLGISLWLNGEALMGAAWIILGLAVSAMLYLRLVKDADQKNRRP